VEERGGTIYLGVSGRSGLIAANWTRQGVYTPAGEGPAIQTYKAPSP